MGLYIKGMDMPQGCGICPFCDYEEGYCLAANDKPTQNGAFRESWCPLVEVKAPHGRLIDENAVMREFAQRDNFSEKTLMDFLMEAPTVLEAEG